MVSGITRKLSDHDDDHDVTESSSRTRPRLEIQPLGFGIPKPPSPVNNTDQDLQTELTMYFYVQQPQPQPQLRPPPVNINQDSNRETELTMYFYVQESEQQQEEQQPQPQQQIPTQTNNPLPQKQTQPQVAPGPRRSRKKPTNAPKQGKSSTIQPPFPWATNRRAHVYSLKYLTENGIKNINGDVECKRCQKKYQIEYNLEAKFKEVFEYVEKNKEGFFDRAPNVWMQPILPKCNFCHQENSMKPVINKKKSINWLFLLLGQMIGCCTLEQLKYFCKHTGNHRTGAKDRVLFLTYIELCKQLNMN